MGGPRNQRGQCVRMSFVMVDAVVALLGLFSAIIFLAHAVDMYQAQQPAGRV
jgi:hypothetical protein